MLTDEIDTSLLLAFGSTVVAAVAAYFSYQSARATLFAYEAHLISDYAAKYASPEFLNHLRVLRKWRDLSLESNDKDFIPLLAKKDPFAVEVDAARRTIKMYYEGIARLGKARYLRKKAVKEICATAGLDLYFDVAVPLTKELHPGMNLNMASYLEGLGMERNSAMKSVS
jgi:hypothetical protein